MDVSKLGKDTSNTKEDKVGRERTKSAALGGLTAAAIKQIDDYKKKVELLERYPEAVNPVGPHSMPSSRAHDVQQEILEVSKNIEANVKPKHWFIWVLGVIFVAGVGALANEFGPDTIEWLVKAD